MTGPLPLLVLSKSDTRVTHKESLQRSTRALIPPRGLDLPGGLTHPEEVALWRIRVGAALTPSTKALWRMQVSPETCPFCEALASEATLDHLLGTYSGLQAVQVRHVRALGYHSGQPPDLHRWTHGPNTGPSITSLRRRDCLNSLVYAEGRTCAIKKISWGSWLLLSLILVH